MFRPEPRAQTSADLSRTVLPLQMSKSNTVSTSEVCDMELLVLFPSCCTGEVEGECVRARVCVCVCVCACARMCLFVCMCERALLYRRQRIIHRIDICTELKQLLHPVHATLTFGRFKASHVLPRDKVYKYKQT